MEVLRRSLGLAEGRVCAGIEREMAEGIAPGRWDDLAAFLDTGTKPDQYNANLFRQALSAYQAIPSGGSLRECLDSYLSVFFTAKDEPRKSIISKGLERARPRIEAELRAEQLRLERLGEERKAAAVLERTQALIVVASISSRNMARRKARAESLILMISSTRP